MTLDVAAIAVFQSDSPDRIRECLAAARAVAAARVELWLCGADADAFATLPVDAVMAVVKPGVPDPTQYATALAPLMAERSCSLLLSCSGATATETMVRLAWHQGASCATAITGIALHDNGLAITRREYAMQMETEFRFHKPPYIFTVARDAFDPVEDTGTPEITANPIPLPPPDWYKDYVETADAATEDLTACDVVLVGGRGLGGSDATRALERLGNSLRAGVGATRPVVLNAWLPMNRMIGVSGVSVRPKVCVLFGVSGSVPFLKGMEKSGFVIAVNSDPDALVFRQSDIGLTADCNQVIARLLEKAMADQERESAR